MGVLVVHEETDDCQGIHCHFHHLDEDGSGYLRCFECGHLYSDKGALVRAYRAVLWSMVKDGVKRYRKVEWRLLWNILTRRAEDIDFCQFCVHDF